MSNERTQEEFRKSLREFLSNWKVQLTTCTDDGILSIEAIMRTGDNNAVQFELTTGDTIGAPLDGYSFGLHDGMLFICDESALHTGFKVVGAYIDRNGNPQTILGASSYGALLARFGFQRFNLEIDSVLKYIVSGLMIEQVDGDDSYFGLDDLNKTHQKEAAQRLILSSIENIASVKDPAFLQHIDLLAGVRGGTVSHAHFTRRELANHVKSEILPMLES